MPSSQPPQTQGSSIAISVLHSQVLEFSLSGSQRLTGGSRLWLGSTSTPKYLLLYHLKCSSKEGVLWSRASSRMESLLAQFLAMLAHQSVCQTIVAFFASLMGPVNSGPSLSCYVATASVLGTDDCHMLQQLKRTLQIMVICDSNSHTKSSEFCAGLRSCATAFG